MSQEIKTAIFTKLTTDKAEGSLWDLVGGRIYELEGEDDANLPLLVYEVASSPVQGLYNGTIIVKAQVVFTIYGHKRLGSANIGTIEEKLFDLLKDSELAPSGYDRGIVVALDRDRRTVFDEIIASESVYSVEATSTS